jgi:hypothetical protein
MAYMDGLLEMRTGVTRQGQGVDADALQNQSATAVAHVFSASQARMKLIARIMAEGVRDIFALLHHTIRSHGQEKQTVRLRNKWVDRRSQDVEDPRRHDHPRRARGTVVRPSSSLRLPRSRTSRRK